MTEFVKSFNAVMEIQTVESVLLGTFCAWHKVARYLKESGKMPPRYSIDGFFDFTDWLRELCPDACCLSHVYTVYDKICAYYRNDGDAPSCREILDVIGDLGCEAADLVLEKQGTVGWK